MTRPEAETAVRELVAGLPAGTPEERVSRAAERLASHAEAEALRGLLVEIGLRALVRAPWYGGRQ